jgi:opacity protein-like surface antigen
MRLARVACTLSFFTFLLVSRSGNTQSAAPAPYQIYGGYSWLSNAFNGLPGAHQGLNGWNAGVGLPPWHGLRTRIEVERFTGDNLGASEKALFIMGGGQYEHALGRERLFAEALFGDISMNRYWGPHGLPGESVSFTEKLGGGVDTPINSHFAIRVEGAYQNENLALIKAVTSTTPYRPAGLPSSFATLQTGLVWTPKTAVTRGPALIPSKFPRQPVAQELIFETLNSFGHVKIFANSWWSYLNVAGVEYDRHSWGSFIGARMDYVAEVLPVAILRQPTKTDVYGNNHSGTARKTIPGLGITPVGLRMIWRDGHAVKPYYEIKGGMIFFTQKAISQYASYENFSLQQSIGAQFKLTHKFDLRAGISHFHFSNAFVVPSNPGIDAMSWNAGLSYHLTEPHPTAQ